jgi:hypothetical protein
MQRRAMKTPPMRKMGLLGEKSSVQRPKQNSHKKNTSAQPITTTGSVKNVFNLEFISGRRQTVPKPCNLGDNDAPPEYPIEIDFEVDDLGDTGDQKNAMVQRMTMYSLGAKDSLTYSNSRIEGDLGFSNNFENGNRAGTRFEKRENFFVKQITPGNVVAGSPGKHLKPKIFSQQLDFVAEPRLEISTAVGQSGVRRKIFSESIVDPIHCKEPKLGKEPLETESDFEMSPSSSTLEQCIATSYKGTPINTNKSTKFYSNSQRGVLKNDAQGNDSYLFDGIISSGPKNPNTVANPGK